MSEDRCKLLCLDLPKAEALRQNRIGGEELERMAARARALADPTRLQIALAVQQGEELCVCDLSWICERSQNLVSHHLKALRAGAIVQSRREGKLMLYRLTESGRELLTEVVASDAARVGR